VFDAGRPIFTKAHAGHDDCAKAAGSANENHRLKNLWDGIDTQAAMMVELEW
jgi:hypothetical protein